MSCPVACLSPSVVACHVLNPRHAAFRPHRKRIASEAPAKNRHRQRHHPQRNQGRTSPLQRGHRGTQLPRPTRAFVTNESKEEKSSNQGIVWWPDDVFHLEFEDPRIGVIPRTDVLHHVL